MMSVPESRAVVGRHDGINGRDNHNTVTLEADTLDEALEKAIEQAGDDPHWKSVDQASQTFVEALAEGMDADPWGDTALPVPDRFTGEPANATGSSVGAVCCEPVSSDFPDNQGKYREFSRKWANSGQ